MACLIIASEANAQSDQGFIYGKIYTIGGDTYQGQMRWDSRGEVYWTDHFNSNKTRDNNLRHLSLQDQQNLQGGDDKGWLGLDWKFLSIWDDKYSNTTHQFVCQFGDIKIIEVEGSDRATLQLKNGVEMEVRGGADLGETIRIYDFELGHIAIKWSRIDKIEFMPTPSRLDDKYGEPLYGTVRTHRKGTFTGQIWWDTDENMSTDVLDGEGRDGDMEIAFGKIKSIEKEARGSRVILNSGREFYLTGTNDVNSENSGIQVAVEGMGRVEIKWKDFDMITFEHNGNSGPSYNSFARPTGLRGTVKVIDDSDASGLIVFDLDEAWEYEVLEGDDDEVEYHIPFRNIKRIRPRNYNYSNVELRNGEVLLLGDRRDVTESNGGILVFTSNNSDPTYISWKKVDEVIFD